jgi:hypothetical protein
MANQKWQRFERLVAAIHAAEEKGSTVIWNDTIKGRQFDVTIRFKNGFYEYLSVIECKDHKRLVPAEAIDSLVTKARDVGANKAIMVSASGYQTGTFEVAQRHGIQLLTLKTINASTQDILTAQLSPLLWVYDFRLRQEYKKHDIAFPDEPGVLRMLMRETSITGPNISTTPEEIVNNHLPQMMETATPAPKLFRVDFPTGTLMVSKNVRPVIIESGRGTSRIAGSRDTEEVSAFLFQYRLVFAKDDDAARRLETMGLGSDPYLTSSVYHLTDEFNKTDIEIDVSRLDMGFDTVLEQGKYYVNPNLGFSYYCERVNGSEVTMCLVESYQMGNLFQCRYVQDMAYARQYVEITDTGEISRLATLLKRFNRD